MSDLDLAIAIAKAKKAKQAAQSPETSMLEQSMSGVNEGIAGILGAPVDLMTGMLNLGGQGVNAAFGTDIQPITNPVGGSGTFRDALAPTISEVEPQTAGQRYGRRIGQEVGAMSVPGGVALRGAKAPLAAAGTEAASAVGAGVAGQTAQEVMPGNATADLIASLLGGGAPIAAVHASRSGPRAPTMRELKAQQSSAYDAVDQSQARLPAQSRDDLIAAIDARTRSMDMDDFLHPRASRTVNRMDSLEASPRIADVEQKRRLVGRDVAGSLDPSESMIGQGMKDEIDTYLRNLSEQGKLGPDATETLDELQRARGLTQRIKKSETVTGLVDKAERRAATSGTGGNEVNAIRQNLRTILDDPKKRRQFSKSELEEIENIVRGTPTVNAARLLGRLSPTSGALPLMAGIGSTAVGTSVGGPIGTGVGMSAMLAGAAGKGVAESLTKSQVDRLVQNLRNGGPVARKGVNRDDLQSLIAALLSQSATSPENNPQRP